MTPVSSVQRNPSQIYRYHVENLREIQIALENIKRLARKAIERQDSENSLISLLRMYTFLIGAWSECRLQKLLHEEFGFTSAERQQVESMRSKLEQWQKTVDLAFRKHYGIRTATLDVQSLGSQNNARYIALRDSLASDLRIVIEVRNKLAHGQWINPLNSAGTALNSDKKRLLDEENLMSLRLKFNLIRNLANIIHDLVVSYATFERDFDSHYKNLCQVRTDLRTRDYNKYKMQLEHRANTRRSRNQLTNNDSDN